MSIIFLDVYFSSKTAVKEPCMTRYPRKSLESLDLQKTADLVHRLQPPAETSC